MMMGAMVGAIDQCRFSMTATMMGNARQRRCPVRCQRVSVSVGGRFGGASAVVVGDKWRWVGGCCFGCRLLVLSVVSSISAVRLVVGGGDGGDRWSVRWCQRLVGGVGGGQRRWCTSRVGWFGVVVCLSTTVARIVRCRWSVMGRSVVVSRDSVYGQRRSVMTVFGRWCCRYGRFGGRWLSVEVVRTVYESVTVMVMVTVMTGWCTV